jgi:hypothetical protein
MSHPKYGSSKSSFLPKGWMTWLLDRFFLAAKYSIAPQAFPNSPVRMLMTATAIITPLVGCTTSPPTPNATVSVTTISYSILAELYCAVKDLKDKDFQDGYRPFTDSEKWLATIDLFLSTAIDGSASPSVSVIGPFNLAKSLLPTVAANQNSFTGAVGASFDQTRTNLREYKVYIFIPYLLNSKSEEKGWIGPDCQNPNRPGTYLEGRLGIEDWLYPAFSAQQFTRRLAPDPTKPMEIAQKYNFPVGTRDQSILANLVLAAAAVNNSSSSPVISTTLTFTIKAAGNIGPSFVTTRVSGGSGSFLSLTRTDSNYVNISLTPIGPYSRADQEPIGPETLEPPDPGLTAAAVTRLENALLNLNLQRLLTP